MIYDALRQAQSGATPASPTDAASVGVGPAPRSRQVWLMSGLGAALCLGIVVLAASHLREGRAPAAQAGEAAATGVPATAVALADTVTPPLVSTNAAPPVTTALPPLPAFSRPTVAAAANVQQPAPTVAERSPTAPAQAPATVAETAGSTASGAAGAGNEVKEVRSELLDIRVSRATAAPANSEAGVSGHLAALDRALANNDTQAVSGHLQALATQLPASSLTLLRAQAWAAHSMGDADEAESHYRAILQRVPNDEQAGVNLALLEAARGDREAAQARLRRLQSHNGTSALVAKAMDQLSGASRL